MSDESALNDDFRDMLAALAEAQVEFIVVGAHAMAVHGVPRATGDIDLFVRPTNANAVRVLRALHSFGAPVASLAAEDFAKEDVVYQIGLPPRRIDLLTSISGVSFEEAWASRVTLEIDGREVAFLGKAALLHNKRASGRDKDLVDARLLESAPGPRNHE